MHLRCFIFLVFIVLPAYGGDNMISSRRKSAFVDHIAGFISQLVAPNNASATSAPSSTPSRPVVPISTRNPVTYYRRTRTTSANPTTTNPVIRVRPYENPAAAVSRFSDSIASVVLQQTIAPPAVRPCFVRPAFCPATSDACSKSRCARLYSNGVRIGSRFYKRVKCRLNYCRETCGKAEWFADGRRLVGCADSSSTMDSPIWSVQRVYPRPSRIDSRVLPVERVASPRPLPATPTRPTMTGFTPRSANIQRRDVPLFNIAETLANATSGITAHFSNVTREFAKAVKEGFDSKTEHISNATYSIRKIIQDALNDTADAEHHLTKQATTGQNSTAAIFVSTSVAALWPVAVSLFVAIF